MPSHWNLWPRNHCFQQYSSSLQFHPPPSSQAEGPSYILVCIVSISHVVYVNPAFFATDKIFWLEAISYPIMGFVITESILTLQKTIRNQVQRMKILNNVAQSLASSLEIHQVIALLSSAIQNALDAETYFVGLMDGENSVRSGIVL